MGAGLSKRVVLALRASIRRWRKGLLEGTRRFGDFCATLRGVVQVHLLLAPFFPKDTDHRLDFRGGEERIRAKGARTDAFLDTNDFAAV